MNIKVSSPNLPKLPQVPNDGKGRLETDVSYQGPETVETRLGSIPADYETYSGWEKRERIYFRDGQKEARNPRGRSRDIWRAQPTYHADGSPRIHQITETIVAEPKSQITTPLKWGALGAVGGGFVGLVVGLVANLHPGVSAAVGAGAVGLGLGALGLADAKSDRVRLEWQNTPIEDHNLVGYIHDVDEDTKTECSGFGDDRRCREVTDDYEHEFYPIIEKTQVGSYFKPVVVHYKDRDRTSDH